MNVTGANSGLLHREPLVRDRAAEGIAPLGLGPSPLEAVAASIASNNPQAKKALKVVRVQGPIFRTQAPFIGDLHRAATGAAEAVMARVAASGELEAAVLAAQPQAEAASLAVIQAGLAAGRSLEELTSVAAAAATEVVKVAIAPIFAAARAEAEEASRQVFSQFEAFR
jgi:hypothetical protein